MDPTCVVVRNAFHTITKIKEWGCLYANLVKRTRSSLSRTCVCGFGWNNNHVEQRNPHTSELHAWPGLRDSRRPESIHLTVTSITFFVPDFTPSILVGLFLNFSLKVRVNTKNHNLAWNIAQQLFTELQKRTIWLIYTQYLTLSRLCF